MKSMKKSLIIILRLNLKTMRIEGSDFMKAFISKFSFTGDLFCD